MTTEVATVTQPVRRSLVAKLADRWEVEPAKLLNTLKQTVFKTERGVSDEQMMSLLIVANEYKLNPFRKELLAFPDRNGAIVPFITIDGWASMIARHPLCDGYTITHDTEHDSMTCTMYRKDWSHPVVVTEYMRECRRKSAPWDSHPLRMLRHKTLIQCARIALGFGGVLDEDEAERVREGSSIEEATTYAGTTRARGRRVVADAAKHLDLPHVDEVSTPVGAPTGAPVDDTPLALPFDQYAQELRAAEDFDAAVIVLDRARILPEPQLAELRTLFNDLYPEDQA